MVAALLGLALALIIWGPVLLRPFSDAPPIDLRALAPHDRAEVLRADLRRAPARIAKPAPRSPIDINRADAATLQSLPGIGPTLARRIVEHRRTAGRFASPDQLLEVEGIGPKRYQMLKSRIEAR
jgi:competence protein ComEA